MCIVVYTVHINVDKMWTKPTPEGYNIRIVYPKIDILKICLISISSYFL